MSWKRARSEEKKNERREAICRAAIELFRNKNYDEISLSQIAAKAETSKSNIYRYFSSREEIFLDILSELLEQWSESCLEVMAKIEADSPIRFFAEQWVECTLPHKELLDLIPLFFTSLEKNSSYEQVAEYKRKLNVLVARHSEEINRIFPKISLINCHVFIFLNNAILSTLRAASSNNKILARLYEQEEFQHFKTNFEQDLINAIEILILGLIAKEEQSCTK